VMQHYTKKSVKLPILSSEGLCCGALMQLAT
jgi:hypothetical protein